jgi:hypothetical protein
MAGLTACDDARQRETGLLYAGDAAIDALHNTVAPPNDAVLQLNVFNRS